MNPMQNKTAEERSAIAAKSHATRRARLEAQKSDELQRRKYASVIEQKINALEKKLESLLRMEAMNAVSAAITGKALLRADEISRAALPWQLATGVYFLLDGDEIVYVGQALNIYSRISQHTDKKFDRYAFVPCSADSLNSLESLYIHCLRPRFNGNQRNNVKAAPIPLDALVSVLTTAQTPPSTERNTDEC